LTDESIRRFDELIPARFLAYERLNAALALAGAEALQIDLTQAADALQDYPGIKRRQSVVWNSPDQRVTVLEDYAHHPNEVKSSLAVIKARYPGSRIAVVFQPHRYRRLRCYFREFVDVLSNKDLTVKVFPVFSAWENPPVDALENSDLAQAIQNSGGNAEAVSNDLELLADNLTQWCKANADGAVIALIGAGDVNDLTPELTRTLDEMYKSNRGE
jgi:UDP-N-acetylmuramate--alanine ligase